MMIRRRDDTSVRGGLAQTNAYLQDRRQTRVSIAARSGCCAPIWMCSLTSYNPMRVASACSRASAPALHSTRART